MLEGERARQQAKEQAKVQEQQTIQLRPHIDALIGERDEVRQD
jgi:hypothetical protein